MHIQGTLRALHEKKVELFEQRLSACLVSSCEPLQVTVAVTDDPVPFAGRLALDYHPVALGETWGSAWQSAWFHVTGRVPEAWSRSRVDLRMDVNGEALLFDRAGTPVDALSTTSIFKGPAPRERVLLRAEARGDEEIDLWLEASACSLFGVALEKDPPVASPRRHGVHAGILKTAELVRVDASLTALWLDFGTLLGVMKAQPEQSTRRVRLLRGLSEAVDLFGDDRANAGCARERLRPLLESPARASAVTVHAVGHAHIDVSWLWPLRETRKKAARTFASQIALIDRFPGFVFGASQPQLYAFVKEDHPELYRRIRAAVAAGAWEPQGAMWVEADCNVIGGESMVRQILHGKAFFMDEFGVDVRNLWLPDVFGYSAAMPQIMRKAGIEAFLTQKLSWSQFNRFPHTTFRWRGIDGSEVLTHFPPEDSYNSELKPEDLQRAETRFEEKDVLDDMLCLFGIGDGGGGPREEFIERALRMNDLEGAPRVRLGRADEFFRTILPVAGELPVWSGELYLELHRGTLTTQAAVKRGNRELELALRAVELMWSCLPPERWPAGELDRLWKSLLVHQFHDDIPGSSVHRVYKDTLTDYEAVRVASSHLLAAAAAASFPAEEDAAVLVNPLSSPFVGAVPLPDGWQGVGADGPPTQRETDGTVVALVEIPAMSAVTLRRGVRLREAEPRPGLVLENELVRYELDERARLTRILDKVETRDIGIPGEPGNRLGLYEDRTGRWDAWDVEIYYEQQLLEDARGVSVRHLGAGPVRQGLEFRLAIGSSEIVQRVTLEHGSRRLDFATEVTWLERHRMLRVSFPVAVSSDAASFDIQYGTVSRPTHRNTSWDLARFEVCGHRFADLSDQQYGVALLNDCKYGYKVHGHTLDLNLLRSPSYPDADADRGEHSFAYSLLPHPGTLRDSDVRSQAAALNQPPLLFRDRRAEGWTLPVVVEGEGVSLEVLKKAEKSNDLILRIVEVRGCRAKAFIRLRAPYARITETDLMEWNDIGPVATESLEIEMGAFDIRTFRLT